MATATFQSQACTLVESGNELTLDYTRASGTPYYPFIVGTTLEFHTQVGGNGTKYIDVATDNITSLKIGANLLTMTTMGNGVILGVTDALSVFVTAFQTAAVYAVTAPTYDTVAVSVTQDAADATNLNIDYNPPFGATSLYMWYNAGKFEIRTAAAGGGTISGLSVSATTKLTLVGDGGTTVTVSGTDLTGTEQDLIDAFNSITEVDHMISITGGYTEGATLGKVANFSFVKNSIYRLAYSSNALTIENGPTALGLTVNKNTTIVKLARRGAGTDVYNTVHSLTGDTQMNLYAVDPLVVSYFDIHGTDGTSGSSPFNIVENGTDYARVDVSLGTTLNYAELYVFTQSAAGLDLSLSRVLTNNATDFKFTDNNYTNMRFTNDAFAAADTMYVNIDPNVTATAIGLTLLPAKYNYTYAAGANTNPVLKRKHKTINGLLGGVLAGSIDQLIDPKVTASTQSSRFSTASVTHTLDFSTRAGGTEVWLSMTADVLSIYTDSTRTTDINGGYGAIESLTIGGTTITGITYASGISPETYTKSGLKIEIDNAFKLVNVVATTVPAYNIIPARVVSAGGTTTISYSPLPADEAQYMVEVTTDEHIFISENSEDADFSVTGSDTSLVVGTRSPITIESGLTTIKATGLTTTMPTEFDAQAEVGAFVTFSVAVTGIVKFEFVTDSAYSVSQYTTAPVVTLDTYSGDMNMNGKGVLEIIRGDATIDAFTINTTGTNTIGLHAGMDIFSPSYMSTDLVSSPFTIVSNDGNIIDIKFNLVAGDMSELLYLTQSVDGLTFVITTLTGADKTLQGTEKFLRMTRSTGTAFEAVDMLVATVSSTVVNYTMTLNPVIMESTLVYSLKTLMDSLYSGLLGQPSYTRAPFLMFMTFLDTNVYNQIVATTTLTPYNAGARGVIKMTLDQATQTFVIDNVSVPPTVTVNHDNLAGILGTSLFDKAMIDFTDLFDTVGANIKNRNVLIDYMAYLNKVVNPLQFIDSTSTPHSSFVNPAYLIQDYFNAGVTANNIVLNYFANTSPADLFTEMLGHVSSAAVDFGDLVIGDRFSWTATLNTAVSGPLLPAAVTSVSRKYLIQLKVATALDPTVPVLTTQYASLVNGDLTAITAFNGTSGTSLDYPHEYRVLTANPYEATHVVEGANSYASEKWYPKDAEGDATSLSTTTYYVIGDPIL